MNYAALKTAVAQWTNRTDLADKMATLVQLAEQRIWYGDQASNTAPLRHLSMLTTATLTPSGGAITLPTDFIDLERVAVTTDNTKVALGYLSAPQLAQYELQSGSPQFFAMRASQMVFGPRFTSPVELVYYARAATPVADSDENWIMRDAFGLYLYGMLAEVGLFLRDAELQANARDLYRNALASLQRSGDQRQMGGFSPLSISVR